MASSTPGSPAPIAAATPGVRSTPGPATRTPVHLGLGGCTAAAAAPRRAVPSLSIKTADGSRVSILNDNDESGGDGAAADHKRCSSVPGLSPGSSPASASPFRAQSTPGAATPHQLPAMLPSLSTLVQAVRMVSSPPPSAPMPAASRTASLRRSISTSSTASRHPYLPAGNARPHGSPSLSVPGNDAAAAAAAAYAAATGAKTTGKRKYKCVFGGCGKAFTTSGHLARHQRIHTGEKNFSCLFPGCASRFSRQDNMMQHYRTHLSSKSRRNASPRKVVFVEAAGNPCRTSHNMYPGQVFGGSHPIQHQLQHHPYGPPSSSSSSGPVRSAPAAMRRHEAAPSRVPPQQPQHQQQQPPSAGGHRAAHCGLPSMRMFSGPGSGPAAPAPPHEYRGGMAKQSPAVAHPGTMAFY
ncbi:hypothetical protein LPJ61_004287 [Coemansia biformis]|uniref:C2H2-type domain-containing protein n=1 Tax=Coemansia biformis TaxID=1286918 RepID=A0A9W8CUU3_9FUNG|nr:hypothetical protein LPJ61_004287 [Coemansia biformis]